MEKKISVEDLELLKDYLEKAIEVNTETLKLVNSFLNNLKEE